MIKQIALLRDLGLEDIAALVNQELVSQHLHGVCRDEYRWNHSATQKRLKLKNDAKMQEKETVVLEQPEGMGVSELDITGTGITGEVKKRKEKSLTEKIKRENWKAKKKEKMLVAAIQRLGRYIRVYNTSVVASSDLSDALQEECQEVHAKEDKTLKTLKPQEEEQSDRRSMFTNSTIKVRFPDNFTLEATFHPSDDIQSLIDFLKQVVSEPEQPFYIYTTTPEKHLIDMSQDFYSAGFVPGATVYFSYDVPKGEDSSSITGPFLKKEIRSLKDVVLTSEAEPAVANTKEPPYSATSPPSHI